jgi:hypothetical protein
VSTDAPRLPPNTKEGWNAFVSRQSRPEPPQLLPEADLARLDSDEREVYDYARMNYHGELNLINTPDIRKVITAGEKLIIGNRGKQLGRRGLIVSGPSGTGKSTSVTWLGKIHQVDTERRASRAGGRIPVVYIIVPPDATPKMLTMEIAAFLGLPFSSHEPQHHVTRSVTGVLRKVGCSLVLVDEIHRLDLRTRPGAAASDQLKYLFDSVGATFVYAGLDLAENGMFGGMRGRQIAGRFISLTTSAFGYATDAQKQDWANLVAPIEASLRLHRHKPGTLLRQAAYLHQRTGGMIGSLDQLIHEAANDAITDGTEKITRKHLDAIVLDTAAEEQYRPPAPRRPATAAARKASP